LSGFLLLAIEVAKQDEGGTEINLSVSKLPCGPHLQPNCVSHLNDDTPSVGLQMTNRDEIAWFKEHFAGEIIPASAGTPLSFEREGARNGHQG